MMRFQADWLSATTNQKVFTALEAVGGPDCVRFVGGCVRNALMGAGVTDVDMATKLPPQQVMTALVDAGLKAVPTGLDHGTVTAVVEGQGFEITTLRRDVETDGRRAVVAFSDDWREDAERRDFTINALYADASGQVFDPTTKGLVDIRDRRVRFIGDAAIRIQEDALRILRFFRFHAWYGQGDLDPKGLAACDQHKDLLNGLSAERVQAEMLKLLAAPDPRPVLRQMDSMGLLALVLMSSVLDQAVALDRLAAVVADEHAHRIPPDGIVRLAALLPTPDMAQTVAAHLKLSKADSHRLVALAAPLSDVSEHELKARMTSEPRDVILDQYRLQKSGCFDIDLYHRLKSWDVPVFPVGGQDLAALGYAPGPEMGVMLKRLKSHWVSHDFPNRQTMLALAQQWRDQASPSSSS